MKKTDIFLFYCAILIFSTMILTLFYMNSRSQTQTKKIELLEMRLCRLENCSANDGSLEARYIVAIQGGKLGVFGSDGRALLESYPLNLSALTACDRDFLMTGIRVYSESELVSVISDYTS